jgi:phosphoribosyl 1,2-cyclic phosphodiesterase
MSLFTASLNSGSNGNCYYVGNENEAVLIDAGISCRETEKRFLRLGLDIKKVKAIFISHEHTDHINGVDVLSRKYNIPIYITAKTLRAAVSIPESSLIKNFIPNEIIRVGNLKVIPFSKRHDAIDPYSFVVKNEEVCIGVMTDIGSVCDQVIEHFKKCHAVFLEANYDEEMLENGPYPTYLKSRISGEKGHLSNCQAVELFSKHRSPFLTHIFLSHLSKENNSPEAALLAFEKIGGETKVIVASRYKESDLFHITTDRSKETSELLQLPGRQTVLF